MRLLPSSSLALWRPLIVRLYILILMRQLLPLFLNKHQTHKSWIYTLLLIANTSFIVRLVISAVLHYYIVLLCTYRNIIMMYQLSQKTTLYTMTSISICAYQFLLSYICFLWINDYEMFLLVIIISTERGPRFQDYLPGGSFLSMVMVMGHPPISGLSFTCGA